MTDNPELQPHYERYLEACRQATKDRQGMIQAAQQAYEQATQTAWEQYDTALTNAFGRYKDATGEMKPEKAGCLLQRMVDRIMKK